MKISIPYFAKKFTAESKKEAYIAVMKWMANNVISSQDEVSETQFSIIEEKGYDLPTYKLTLFCMLDENEHKNKFCDICKKYHKSFFINQDYNCSKCNMVTYRARVEETLMVKRSYRKERLKYKLNKVE